MKKHSKIVAIIFAFVLCIAPLFSSVLTVSAEGPVTYYLKYDTVDEEWKYQIGSSWQDNGAESDLQDLINSIKNGDSLAIEGDAVLILPLNVSLENLSIVRSTQAVITAKSYDEVYVLGNSTCAINGYIKEAYVYDACIVNFNNDIGKLELMSVENVNLSATIAVVGTVDHLKASGSEFTHFEFYNFEKGSLLIEEGHLQTVSTKYSETPKPAVPAAPTTPSAPAAGEYDDVPKTGDFSVSPLWFLGLAVICLAGHYSLKRR